MTGPSRRVKTMAGAITLALALLLGGSFAWFVHQMGRAPDLPPHTDGIVAFTGGPERVETALRLLANGRADRLLLSGVGGGAELPELAHRAGVDPTALAARVTLDRAATTTRANAAQTAAWARSHDIHSLLVVTASYHMPRAIAELSRALPEVTLYPMPVVGPERPDHPAAPLRLVAEEYVKYLATAAGLSGMLPPREPAPVHGGHAG